MKKIFRTLLIICCLSGFAQKSLATSLDELYRDVIRADNSGYLPLFVKNRKAPMVSLEEEDLIPVKPKKQKAVEYKGEILNLTNDVSERVKTAQERQLQWGKTIAAIKSNQVTPVELDDITNRVRDEDPKAIEILAWMYTNGVGVSKDFVEAFNLYKRAAQLNVTNAEKNAIIVYKSMNEEQRRRIKNNL
ncbi:MAG: SEL1-like repeat protein [Alphaproteobacteria bacterium]|nr:SEL1-like repeat protein [Alphaproteobacteria bacterium]